MPTPILTTKLYMPPPRANTVIRSHLHHRLVAGMYRKLTLVSAPAGFGKTTLVSEWVLGCERNAVWLSLDKGDSEPTRFLNYLIAALQTMATSFGKGIIEMLQSPQPVEIETILTALLNELAALPCHFVLVLDDYHTIDTELIDQILAFFIEHQPPQMHMVMITREDPRLPLARLRVLDQLTELRAADLRFSHAETGEFLNGVMNLNLSLEEIDTLETRTEGWIAGLQLAAISMSGQKNPSDFIKSFTGTHHFVLDYLTEEVLHQQPEHIQTFLLSTAILERFSGALCDAVLHESSISGQTILAYLQQANLFVIPLDDERCWYRYHHLFAELLRQRLFSVYSENTIAELHQRASSWFEAQGLESEAFHHAMAGKNFVRAAHLAELAWPAMDMSLQSGTWLNWVKTLPEETIRVRPVLRVGWAWALIDAGELEEGESRLWEVEHWLNETEPGGSARVIADEQQFHLLPALIAMGHAYCAQSRGDIEATIQYTQQVLALLPQEEYLRRGTSAGLLGLAYWSKGKLAEAYQTLIECMAGIQRAGNNFCGLGVAITFGPIKLAQGQLQEAVGVYERIFQQAKEGSIPADLYTLLASLYCEQGNLDLATTYLIKSKELGKQSGLPDWQYRWHVGYARLMEAQGEFDSALENLQEAERLHFRTPLPSPRPTAALKAQVWLRQGRLHKVRAWVQEKGLSVDDELRYLQEFEHLVLAKLLIAEALNGKTTVLSEAITLLERLAKAAGEGQRTGSLIEILVVQALAHQTGGNQTKALTTLEDALILAEPEGYFQVFIDEGQPMAGLLTQLKTEYPGINAYRQKLLTRCKHTPHTLPLLIDPLSQRELEVLQLIARGFSNHQISEQLFLALSTVKGHNQNIFGKLQVQRRTEAIVRARELGLL